MLLDITCIRILDFNICLCKSVINYLIIGNNWRIVVIFDFLSIGL